MSRGATPNLRSNGANAVCWAVTFQCARSGELGQQPVALLGAEHAALGGLGALAVAIGVAGDPAVRLVGAVLAAVEDIESGDRPPGEAPEELQVRPDRLARA